MNAIVERYNAVDGTNLRNNYINSAIESQGDQAETNLQTNIQDSITRSQESRQDYLDSLSAPVTTTVQ